MIVDAILYHDGCDICISVVETMLKMTDSKRVNLRVINLDFERAEAAEAEMLGVKTLPSLLIDGKVFEISPHARIAEFYPSVQS